MTAVALQVKVCLPAEACSPCLGRAPDLEQQGRGQTSSSENGRRNRNDARMSSATNVEAATHAVASSGKTAGRLNGAHSTPNTQIAPPSGTSGKFPGDAALRTLCMTRASTPQPACTAMYCLPPTVNDDGGPVMPELVGNSHSSLPLDASNAWNLRSLVPPVKTSPPPVASIGPQFEDMA